MRNWGVVLSLFFSLSLYSKTITFHGSGRAEATLSSITIPSSLDGHPVTIKTEFSLPALELNPTEDGFSIISVGKLYPKGSLGNPDVGVTGSLLVIPSGFEPVLTIIQQETKTLGHTLLTPTQHKVRCNCDSNGTFHFNAMLYKSPTLYPTQVANLERIGTLQNIEFARINIQPLQQDFKNESVIVTTHLKLEVSFRQISRPESQTFTPFAHSMASALATNAADALSIEEGSRSLLETMVLFTADGFEQHLKPFIEWKKLRGIDVKLFTLSQLGGTREKAKEFLQNLYNEFPTKPSYLLIVGDRNSFPAFDETTTTGEGTQIAITDYPYSLLSGNDVVPDLLYGRFLVSNEEELRTVISKVIGFERSPEKDRWYTVGTTIASNEGSNPSDKEYALQIQETLKKYTYKEMDSFFQGDQTAKEEGLITAINQGRSWLTYFGHGSGTSWGSFNDKFDLQSIEKFQNGRHPVVIDVACKNADFKSIDKPFGKAWMVQTNGSTAVGASGYYGGSVNISWHPPAIMATGIAKSHFEKKAYSFGASVLGGQLFLIEQKGTNNETIDNLRWYNLFGDPSLLLRTDVPKPLLVERGKRTKRGAFQIRVTSNGAPIEGAVVSAVQKNGLISSVKTSAEGMATLPFASRLVVTGYNLETFETDLD